MPFAPFKGQLYAYSLGEMLFAETSGVQISENFWVNMQCFAQGTSLRKSCVMGGAYSLG